MRREIFFGINVWMTYNGRDAVRHYMLTRAFCLVPKASALYKRTLIKAQNFMTEREYTFSFPKHQNFMVETFVLDYINKANCRLSFDNIKEFPVVFFWWLFQRPLPPPQLTKLLEEVDISTFSLIMFADSA